MEVCLYPCCPISQSTTEKCAIVLQHSPMIPLSYWCYCGHSGSCSIVIHLLNANNVEASACDFMQQSGLSLSLYNFFVSYPQPPRSLSFLFFSLTCHKLYLFSDIIYSTGWFSSFHLLPAALPVWLFNAAIWRSVQITVTVCHLLAQQCPPFLHFLKWNLYCRLKSMWCAVVYLMLLFLCGIVWWS